jgi:hypothetical protein
LLKLNLSIQPGISVPEATRVVAKYVQSFPFAVVLPVQPLQYLPTPDNGVEIQFLRKKTDIKSGIDGGIRIFVTTSSPKGSDGEDHDEDNNDNVNESAAMIEVTAKRNSVGQSIQKIMAEKLVVTALVASITGEDTQYGKAPLDAVNVSSLYHKWM